MISFSGIFLNFSGPRKPTVEEFDRIGGVFVRKFVFRRSGPLPL